MLGRAPEAEEATQETFLRAYQALGRFNGRYYLGAWLSRIAANVCVDQLRSRSRATLVALPDDLESVETGPGPEDVVVGDHPRLEAAIDAIQPLHASALRLRAVQGLSHQEMAHHLAMSPSQVKALLHRARTSLRRAWDRVEGMALVPLLYVRHLYDERTGQEAGTRVAGIAPALSPALAERVAASAVVVVTALAGVQGMGVPKPPSEPSLKGNVTAQEPRRSDMTAFQASAARHAPETSNTAAATKTALLVELEVDVPVELAEEREGTPRQKRNDDEPEGGSGPPSQGAAGKKVVREVRQTAHDVREALTDS
jgi:RNA polymerase sigma-70 factor (ECF subfamily)